METKSTELIFQKKIDADIKIEPKDWMPDEYRRNLIRQIFSSVLCENPFLHTTVINFIYT